MTRLKSFQEVLGEDQGLWADPSPRVQRPEGKSDSSLNVPYLQGAVRHHSGERPPGPLLWASGRDPGGPEGWLQAAGGQAGASRFNLLGALVDNLLQTCGSPSDLLRGLWKF